MSAQHQVSIFKVATMYMGAVIGAGFASGQEIMQFFTVYGRDAYKELILVTLLFSYLGASTLYLAVKLRTNHYLDLVRYLLGPRSGVLFDGLIMAMLLGGVGIMLSGSGAVFEEHLHLPAWLGIALVAAINYLILWRGLAGVLGINAVLVPVKITIIVVLCLLIVNSQNTMDIGFGLENILIEHTSRTWFMSGILYVSYNMILVLAVLATLGPGLSRVKAVTGGAMGGIGLGLTAAVLCWAGLALLPGILNYQVPTIYMAELVIGAWKYPMGFLIWLAILTTALANTHGLAARWGMPGSARYRWAALGILVLALPAAMVDFDRLVGVVYPMFGYAGLLMMLALMLAPIRYKLAHRHYR